jgi:hypothetical protein
MSNRDVVSADAESFETRPFLKVRRPICMSSKQVGVRTSSMDSSRSTSPKLGGA